MATYYYNGYQYRLTSRKNGGQYSGPCPYSGEGVDRFTIEPATQRWFCRKCSESCNEGLPGRNNTRAGTLDWKERPMPTYKPVLTAVHEKLSPDIAFALAESLNDAGRAYLYSRGINDKTIAKFHLGMRFGKQISIPLLFHWNGEQRCQAIKFRWLPQHKPDDASKYVALAGSNCKGIFNFDTLAESQSPFVVIANSLFDVMLIDQLGLPCVGSFAGEASWEAKWAMHFKTDTIINLGDRDENGAGERYMLQRAFHLQSRSVINLLPLSGLSDINEMVLAGLDVRAWLLGYASDFIL